MPAVHSVPAAVARPLQVAPIEFLPQIHSVRTYTVMLPDDLVNGLNTSVKR